MKPYGRQKGQKHSNSKFEEFDKELVSDTGDLLKKANKSVIKWTSKNQEKLLKTYAVNSKYNSKTTSYYKLKRKHPLLRVSLFWHDLSCSLSVI